MVYARQSLGDVSKSEPQTLRRGLNFSQCHFCKYQSTIRDRIEREKLEYLLHVYFQNMYTELAYILYYVDIGCSGEVFSVSLTM